MTDMKLMPGCRWTDPPADHAGSGQQSWSIPERLGFDVVRIFWLTSLAENQWRGRHAHRESILGTFVVKGRCRLTLDNARQQQVVDLREGGPGLIIGAWIWHDLYDFSSDAVVLVLASTLYDEGEYIRDYDAFVREAKDRRISR
jgi:hypothetical protein